MNDHLISNEVVVVVVVQAGGESIILDQLHLCSICGPAKEKKLDEGKSKHEVVWLNKTVWGPAFVFHMTVSLVVKGTKEHNTYYIVVDWRHCLIVPGGLLLLSMQSLTSVSNPV
jgi:hypothetical protein